MDPSAPPFGHLGIFGKASSRRGFICIGFCRRPSLGRCRFVHRRCGVVVAAAAVVAPAQQQLFLILFELSGFFLLSIMVLLSFYLISLTLAFALALGPPLSGVDSILSHPRARYARTGASRRSFTRRRSKANIYVQLPEYLVGVALDSRWVAIGGNGRATSPEEVLSGSFLSVSFHWLFVILLSSFCCPIQPLYTMPPFFHSFVIPRKQTHRLCSSLYACYAILCPIPVHCCSSCWHCCFCVSNPLSPTPNKQTPFNPNLILFAGVSFWFVVISLYILYLYVFIEVRLCLFISPPLLSSPSFPPLYPSGSFSSFDRLFFFFSYPFFDLVKRLSALSKTMHAYHLSLLARSWTPFLVLSDDPLRIFFLSFVDMFPISSSNYVIRPTFSYLHPSTPFIIFYLGTRIKRKTIILSLSLNFHSLLSNHGR